jgi:hypothetical protein
LLNAIDRDLGQAPPDWLLLSVGGLAYANPARHVVACDSFEHYRQYNESGDEGTSGCKVVPGGALLAIEKLLPQEAHRYIVVVNDAKSLKSAGYLGAGDLSPEIPRDVELVVMNTADGTDQDASETVPELVDQKGQKIGKLLDHTMVRVRQMFPGRPITYIAVTVLSGELQNHEGYIDLDDLNALTGDDQLDGYLGSTNDILPAATSSQQPLTATREDITQAVSAVFNRQTATPGPNMPPLFTPALLNSEAGARRIMEVLGADDVTSRIDGVHGNTADVTELYVLTSDKKAKLHFVRHDRWTFTRGSIGWLLDGIAIKDKRLQSVESDGGSLQIVSESHFDSSSGRVLFTLDGVRFAWTPRRDLGWAVSPISESSPATRQLPTSSAGATTRQSTSGFVPDQTPTDAENGCSSESIDSISGDGAVVKLLDGRRFLIQESQRFMTAIWLAADDVTVCDPGPGRSAKLIHEDDVVYGGHLN